jgi:hypothetical protein
MALSSRVWFRVVNDLLHDLAAGVAPGSVLAMWLVRNGARTTLDPVALATTTRSWSWIVLLLFVALGVVIVTGAVRLNYWSATVRPEDQKSRGRAALVKHSVFAVILVGAFVVAIGLLQG